MKKTISIISVIVVLLAICLGITMYLTVKLVSPNEFKEQISKIVYAKTGRQLTINGSLGWSFFPWLGVKTYDVDLNNSDNFKGTRFASIGELDIQVKLIPLFFGKVSVGKLILKNTELRLVESETGENNWVDLLTTLSTPEGAPTSTADSSKQLDISNIDIANANVYIENHRTNHNLAFTKLSLQSKDLNTQGNTFSINLRTDLQNSAPELSGTLALTGEAIIDFKQKIYALNNMHAQGTVYKAPYLLNSIPFNINANVITNLDKQTLDIDKFAFAVANIGATGYLHATNVLFAPLVKGDIQSSTFDPKPFLISFGLLPKNLDIKKLPILKAASFKATLQTTSKFLKIPNLEFKLDESLVKGQVNYSHFLYKYVVFNLGLNKLDLDKYSILNARASSPSIKTSTKQNRVNSNGNHDSGASASGADDTSALISGLKLVKLDGDLRIQDLRYSKLHFTNVDTQISGDFGKINFDPVLFDFYNGKTQGTIGLDLRKKAPSLTMNTNLNGVAIQPLFMDIANTNKVVGTANISSTITTKGNSGNAMLSNLNGTGKIALNNGIFYGIDVNYIIDKAKILLSQKTSNLQATQPPRTAFSSLVANFAIKNGILHSNNLLVQAPEFTIKGSGSINLIKLTIDFLLEASGKHTNFRVPIKVSNTLLEPNIVPELSGFMKNILQENLGKNIKDQIQTQGKGDQKTIKIKLDKITDILHL